MTLKKFILATFVIGLSYVSIGRAQWGHALHFNWEERDRAEVLDAPWIWPPQMPTGTIELWFKPDTILAWNTHGPNYTFLLGKNYSGNNIGDFGVNWQENDGRMHWFIENGDVRSSCYSDSTIIPYFEPRWYHFAGTWDIDSGMRIFIDGIKHPEQGSTIALPVTGGDQIFVIGDGSIDHFNDRFETFHGSIDEFRISSVVRYTENFDIPAEPFEIDANTLALWHFDEGLGAYTSDATGNGFDAHLGGQNPPGPFPTVDTLLTKPDWVAVQATGVNRMNDAAQFNFTLLQNYPNPFNPVTTIHYSLPENSDVKLTIYDVKGREVSVLVEQNQNAGSFTVKWNGTNAIGQKLPTGIYFYKIQANNFVTTKKMVFMK